MTIPAFSFLLLTLLIGGCDNTLKPFDDRQGFYSIYGYLDLYSDVNFIRVKDLNEPLQEDSTRMLNATVTFRDMDSGESEVLEDSVVRFEGVYTHNFRTTMDIQPGTTYRVIAEGPDGSQAFATATTPEFAETDHSPEMPDCTTQVVISFEPVIHPNDLSAQLGFEYQGRRYWINGFTRQGEGEQQTIIRVVPREMMTSAFENLDAEAPWCHELSDDRFFVRYTHYSADFFEQIDTDTLSIPGGAGRFGALYEDTFSFRMDTSNVCFPFC